MRKDGEYPRPRFTDPNDVRLVSIVRKEKHALRDAVNIMGVPFDGAVLGRRGAAEGPAAIRHAMGAFSNYNAQVDVRLEGKRISDLGDIVDLPEDVVKAHSIIEQEAGREILPSSLLAILGGDNSISLPCLRALGKKFGKIGLIVVDSHLDLRGKIGGKPTSGSSYGLALETIEGLEPSRVVEIGSHGFLNSWRYVKKARDMGVTLVSAEDVASKGARRIAEEAVKRSSKGARAVYLSIDMDSVDLSQVSGVSAPSTGGIFANQLLEIAYRVAASHKVKASDIVELAPTLDSTGRSQVVAATALVYLIGGFVSRRRS